MHGNKRRRALMEEMMNIGLPEITRLANSNLKRFAEYDQNRASLRTIMVRTAPEKAEQCIKCGKTTTEACRGCKDAPVHFTTDSPIAYYCSQSCRKADEKSHKATCKLLSERKALYKAASLLKVVFLAVRRNSMDTPISKVVESGNTLTVHDIDKLTTLAGLGPFHRFDTGLVQGDVTKEAAVLLAGCCEDVDLILYRLVRQILAGIGPQVQGARVLYQHKNANVQVRIINCHRDMNDPDQGQEVYQVRLSNGETYAVEVTSQQFESEDFVMPWPDYEDARIVRYFKIAEIGEDKHRQAIDPTIAPGEYEKRYFTVLKRSKHLPLASLDCLTNVLFKCAMRCKLPSKTGSVGMAPTMPSEACCARQITISWLHQAS